MGAMDRPVLIIFDCDGVLADSERISNGVLADALSAEGLETTLTQARRDYQGLQLGEVLLRAQERVGRPLPEGWLAAYERDRERAFRNELEAVTGAREAVIAVKAAGVEVCVASQGKLAKTRLSLELTGLLDLFAEGSLFSAESVPRGKPHPDLFLHAAASMGAAAQDCLVVEDTPSGVAAAVAAGMPVQGYAADSDEAALRAAGAEILWSLGELPARLGLGQAAGAGGRGAGRGRARG
jgi:HAD superfamily hydrolase (TIGR01509 family)